MSSPSFLHLLYLVLSRGDDQRHVGGLEHLQTTLKFLKSLGIRNSAPVERRYSIFFCSGGL